MSDDSRNRKFSRKSAKKGQSRGSSRGSKSHGTLDGPRRSQGMRQHTQVSERRSPKARSPKARQQDTQSKLGGSGWIWGTHAVKAVLANPRRTVHRITATERNAEHLDLSHVHITPQIVHGSLLDKEFGTSHQGVAVQTAPLEWPDLHQIMTEADDNALVLVLDQITDPHNVGAMFRLASAFGVSALVMQTRHAPPLSGATAKVAVGCLETVPTALVTNIANTLKDFQNANWMVTGLAGETDLGLSQALAGGGKQVIVMGAEGRGLRPRVRSCCDQLARIPMQSDAVAGEAESLNVATAAAIALYEARRG